MFMYIMYKDTRCCRQIYERFGTRYTTRLYEMKTFTCAIELYWAIQRDENGGLQIDTKLQITDRLNSFHGLTPFKIKFLWLLTYLDVTMPETMKFLSSK